MASCCRYPTTTQVQDARAVTDGTGVEGPGHDPRSAAKHLRQALLAFGVAWGVAAVAAALNDRVTVALALVALALVALWAETSRVAR